ncbi:MAG: hypothetical protein AMJ89_06135, partial [candidate division Zixibacteria bacterium SM23_73]
FAKKASLWSNQGVEKYDLSSFVPFRMNPSPFHGEGDYRGEVLFNHLQKKQELSHRHIHLNGQCWFGVPFRVNPLRMNPHPEPKNYALASPEGLPTRKSLEKRKSCVANIFS